MPIFVLGTDTAGKAFLEDAKTVSVSEHGAAVVLKRALPVNDKIVLRRPKVRREAACRVVGEIGGQSDAYVYNVAFLKSDETFWNISFPPLADDKDTAGRTLLQCELCGARKVVHLQPMELEVYNANQKLSLRCDACRKTTIWIEAAHEPAAEHAPARAEPAAGESPPHPPPVPPRTRNERKHPRISTRMPVGIRQAAFDEDVATTVNISRGGVCFKSRRRYHTGSYIQIAVPYSSSGVNIFVPARVTRSSEIPSEKMFLHGVVFLKS